MIVVAGGGITGLATGFELASRGAEVTVLESSKRAGGVIRSAEVDGRILDWGPQRARMTAGFRRMVDALELESQVVTASPDLELHIYRDGRLRRLPFSVAGLAMSDVVSPMAKLRALLEPLTGGARADEAVADLFTRKFGRDLYETVIGPLYGGLYASDPADMRVGLSLIHVLREFGIDRSLLMPLLRRGGRIRPPAPCSFRGGMQVITDGLAKALGDALRLEAPVTGLERSGQGWRVSADDGRVVEAREVVLATPASVTARLLEPVAPGAATAIGRLRYNDLGVVHLDAETDLTGLGFKVAFGEEALSLSGVTYNDQLFGRRNLYTAYLGGARNPEVSTMDDDELAETAVRDFETTTGYRATVLAVARERMPAWDISWEGLHEIELPEGIHVAGNWWSRPGLPGRLAEAEKVATELCTQAGLSAAEAR
ncbi:MAG: FAD-dependent oxidoreductase [Longimicrobiales bacterium]|nr:FAD-dependent oxidoreductase [Longimicrobiales bacterium]